MKTKILVTFKVTWGFKTLKNLSKTDALKLASSLLKDWDNVNISICK